MAILSVADAKAYHLLGIQGSGSDSEIEELIDRAGVWIAEHLGYPAASAGGEPTVEETTYTHYSGTGEGGVWVSEDGRQLMLPVRPVVSITTIHDDTDWDYGSGDLIDPGDYVLDGVNGYVWLRTDASDQFAYGVERATKVVYVAGFDTVPGPIVQACGMLLRILWDARKNLTRNSISTPATSASLRSLEIPPLVYDLLQPYRLVVGGMA